MRIGVLAKSFMSWAGGIDFIRMVVDCLQLLDRGNTDLVLLVPRSRVRRIRRLLAPWYRWMRGRYGKRGVAELRQSLREQRTVLCPTWQLRQLRAVLVDGLPALFYSDEAELEQLARQQRLDCILPAIQPLPRRCSVPWIGYLADFQHKYLPALFSETECRARDESFRAMADTATHVLVNARTTYDDCVRFLGHARARFVPLPFGASPKADWLNTRPDLLERYDLPPRYFLISNQFWIHKNHRVAFEAMEVLARQPATGSVRLVCTGSGLDTRDRTYFPSLLRFLEERKLCDSVKLLGLIPKRDQIEVMKNATAVVQPSLFEGGPGGGAIYDAISLGVPAVVSDIPINRELEGEQSCLHFFDPNDASALARKLADLWASEPSRPTRQELVERGAARQRRVADALGKVVQSVASHHQPNGREST